MCKTDTSCSALDDKDVHLVTQLVAELHGIGAGDRDDPKEGKPHAAERVLHGARNLTDVCVPGL